MSTLLRFASIALILSLLPTLQAIAQEATAPDDELRRVFQQVEDETRPPEIRSQLVAQLLQDGRAQGIEGLRVLLADPETPPGLKCIIARAALFDVRLSLLDAVVDAAVRDGDSTEGAPNVLAVVEEAVGETHAPTLVRQLAARAEDPEGPLGRRKLVVRLLGLTRGKTAVEPLLALWARNEEGIGAAAREALLAILPVTFHGPDEARDFWVEHGKESLEEVLRGIARRAASGDGTGTERSRFLDFARGVVKQVGVQTLIDRYLGCREMAEVRELGARQLADYSYTRHEADEAAMRKSAAEAVLNTLDAETDPGAVAALLDAVRILMPSARAAGEQRVRRIIVARLDSLPAPPRAGQTTRPPDPRLAAVRALGELKDPTAVDDLTRRYDALAGKEKTLRLAILDAVELCGNGSSAWVHDKLKTNDPDEAVVVRLIQFLKRYKDQPEAEPRSFVPTLIGILKDPIRSGEVRQEAAFALGTVGVALGDEAAVDALAAIGLSSDSPSVREISATQIGRAVKVPGKVIEMLRERLGEVETEGRVRLSAGRSIMNLLAADGVRYLAPHVKNDEFWGETVRAFLTSDLIAGGRAADAAATVRALHAAGLPARVAEAARLVLEAGDLKWEGTAAGGRGEVAYALVLALEAIGEPAQALGVLNDIRDVIPQDPGGVEQNLTRSRLLRATGAPEKALLALERIYALVDMPGDIRPRADLEKARVLIKLGRDAEAIQLVRPLLENPKWGEEASTVTREAATPAGAVAPPPTPAELVTALDSADPAAVTAAVAALKTVGVGAFAPLFEWISKKDAASFPAALKLVERVTGQAVPYDPAAPDADRAKALEALRALLATE